MRSGVRVKTVDGNRLISAVLSAAIVLSAVMLSRGAAKNAAASMDAGILEVMFCSAVPVAHSYIKPKVKLKTSALKLILGFNLNDPISIISSQIAVVSAASKHYEIYETESEEAEHGEVEEPLVLADMPEDAKPIEEVNITPQSAAGYIAADKIYVKNQTSYDVDIAALVNEKLAYTVESGAPQVLIVHTHASESFTPTDKNYYVPTDPDRTEDTNFNITRVGAEMARRLNELGIETLHDKTLHDYPSYNGSYKNSLATVERYKQEYPSIKIVLDVHRDGMTTADGTKLKVCTTIDGKKTAQVMILAGSDANGLEHPHWRENLKLGLKIQAKMAELYPGFPRPLMLVKERYNMNTTKGSLLLEVGSNGNTLEEAINGGYYAAEAIAAALAAER